jgi:aryl-alcohol dehydrogenase-like predicted oxidoreductase
MRRRYLGATGMSVSDMCLGTMMLGKWGNPDHDESIRMIHTALDAGIDFVDTADVYAEGETEEIVGEALKGRRDQVILATKFGLPAGTGPNTRGASPRWIKRAVEASLQRLQTDYIDLYQLHRYDWDTGLDETLGALTDLQRSGVIRAFGHSTFPVEKIVEAQWIAERRGHARFLTEQPKYSIVTRSVEVAVLPTAKRYDMGVLSYGPLASGWLSGRDIAGSHRAERAPQAFDLSIAANQRRAEIVKNLTGVAADAGLPLAHLATAFVRAHPAITSVIIGPRTPEQLADSLAAADVQLSDDVLDRIDEIAPPGVEVNPDDMYLATPPSIQDPTQRRRR